MGSLNSSGERITQDNVSYRNIGGAVTKTEQALPNTEQTLVPLNVFPSGVGTNADLDLTQRTVVGMGSHLKETDTPSNSLVTRITSDADVEESEQPEIQNRSVHLQSETHTGNRVVVRSSDQASLTGVPVNRHLDTGSFD